MSVTAVTASAPLASSGGTTPNISLISAINYRNGGAKGGSNAQWYNVLDYGAVGNGVANDYVSLQSAIQAAATAGGGKVYVPFGASGSFALAPSNVTTLAAAMSSTTVGTFPIISTVAALPYGYYKISDGTHSVNVVVESGANTTSPTVFVISSTGGTVANGSECVALGLQMVPGVSFVMEESTQLIGDGANMCGAIFGFGGFNFKGERYSFGRFSNFGNVTTASGGYAIAFFDSTSFANVTFTEAFNCNIAVYFLANGGGIFGHVVCWTIIRGCAYAVSVNVTQSSGGVQGIYAGGPGSGIISNIQSPNTAIYIKKISGFDTVLSSNVFDIYGINGNTDVSSGIVFDGANFTSGNVFRAINSFGAFGTGQYLKCLNGATFSNQTFELGLYEFPNGAATTSGAFTIPSVGSTVSIITSNSTLVNTSQYAFNADGLHGTGLMLGTVVSGGGSTAITVRCDLFTAGTITSGAAITTALGGAYSDLSGFFTGQPGNVLNCYGGSSTFSGDFAPTYYVAATSSGSRASFNSGNALFFKRVPIAMDLPALSAGQTADYYVYSPFTTGVQKQPTFHVQQMNCNAVLDVVEDESLVAGSDGKGPVANQIHIRIRAFGVVSNGTFVYGVLELMS